MGRLSEGLPSSRRTARHTSFRRRRGFSVAASAIFLGCVYVSGASAQTDEDPPTYPRASASAVASVGSLGDGAVVFLGGTAELEFSSGLRGGGGGFFMSSEARFREGTALSLALGYGGVTISGPYGNRLRWSLLVAGGNIDLSDATTGLELVSSNALVGEASMELAVPADLPVAFAISLGYRLVLPGEKLDDFPIGSLSGVTLTAHLRLPRP